MATWTVAVDGTFDGLSVGSSPIATIPQLADQARGTAFLNLEADGDGVFRRVPLLLRYGNAYAPSMALRIACDYLDVKPQDVVLTPRRSLRLRNARYPGSQRGATSSCRSTATTTFGSTSSDRGRRSSTSASGMSGARRGIRLVSRFSRRPWPDGSRSSRTFRLVRPMSGPCPWIPAFRSPACTRRCCRTFSSDRSCERRVPGRCWRLKRSSSAPSPSRRCGSAREESP